MKNTVIALFVAVLWMVAGCGNDSSNTPTIFNVELGANTADNTALQSVVDSSGNSYIAGKAQSALYNSEKWDTKYGGFLGKYDEAGTLVWGIQLNTTGADISINSLAYYNGHIYVAGTSTETVAGTAISDHQDGFVAQYNGDGALQWLKLITAATPGSTSSINVAKIKFDSNGIAHVAGSSDNGVVFGDKTGVKIGARDGFVLAMDTSGAAVADIEMIGVVDGTVLLNGMDIDTVSRSRVPPYLVSNNIYISGTTSGKIYSTGIVGASDSFVAKYNNEMVLQWGRNYGVASATGIATNLAYSSSNNAVYVGGYSTLSQSGGTFTGSRLPYVASLSASTGAANWLNEAPVSTRRSENIGVAADDSGNLYTVGYSEVDIYGSSHTAMFNDATIVVYNSAGTFVSGTQFGDNESNSAAVFWGVTIAGSQVFVVGSSSFGIDADAPQPQTRSGSYAISKVYYKDML